MIIQLSSQQNPADALKKLYDDHPQEKIYLWYNKSAYVAGETIWFKAYVFCGYDLSFISSSLYVELYNAEKKLISTKLLPLISGTTDGSIDLGNKSDEGVYYIRAYTQWMLNYNEAFQYIHPVLVYNPASAKHLSLNRSAWKAGAFPEGGSLINGSETKIAVRRYAAIPLESKWGGYLYEESNPAIKIKEFSSLDENAAAFTFIPEAGKKYYAYVNDEYGNSQVCALPVASNSGVSISINEISDSITYKLSFQNIESNGNGYSVIGEMQHQLVYNANLKKAAVELSIKIPVAELFNGILHLTVFDPAKRPVAERLVFVSPHKLYYDSNAVLQYMLSAQPRSASELQVKVDSIQWFNYAVSVSDAAAPSSLQHENILSAMWLTSDLINPLQNPAGYFSKPDKNKMEALDAVMISEKWGRFDWNEILNNKYPRIDHRPFNYLSYAGKVTKGNKLKPKEEVSLMLYYPDSTTRVMLAETDSIGNINLSGLVFYEDVKVFYQLNNKKYNAKFIDIVFERNNRFVPYSLPLLTTPYILTSTTSDNITPTWVNRTVKALKMEKDIDDKFKTLQEVVVQSKMRTAKEQLDEKLSSGLFRTNNATVFDFVNEAQYSAQGYTNILQWLQGRVAGLSIQYENGDYVAYIRGARASLYLDEMPIDAGFMNNISVSDIAMIKVIKGPFALALGSGSGTIAIYTLRGNMRPAQKEPSLPNNKIRGYDLTKRFFTPDYGNKSTPQPETDTRDLLLWQPIVVPSVSPDKSTVRFFTNDSAKQIRIIVQGFNESGFPVYFEKVIEPAKKSF